jgi:hypothetical protein
MAIFKDIQKLFLNNEIIYKIREILTSNYRYEVVLKIDEDNIVDNYFDTFPESLLENGLSLRIRNKYGCYFITLKELFKNDSQALNKEESIWLKDSLNSIIKRIKERTKKDIEETRIEERFDAYNPIKTLNGIGLKEMQEFITNRIHLDIVTKQKDVVASFKLNDIAYKKPNEGVFARFYLIEMKTRSIFIGNMIKESIISNLKENHQNNILKDWPYDNVILGKQIENLPKDINRMEYLKDNYLTCKAIDTIEKRIVNEEVRKVL